MKMTTKWEKCPELLSDHSDDSSEETDCLTNNHSAQPQIIGKVESLKSDGNEKFGSGKYLQAIDKYEEALQINEVVPDLKKKLELYFKLKNNICQCYLKRKMNEKALEAAVDAIESGSDQVRSYIRASTAFENLERPEYAYKVLKKGLYKCEVKRDEILKELNSLQARHPKIQKTKVKEMNWLKLDVKELMDNLKKCQDVEQEEKIKKKKATEEKKKQAKETKEAKAKEDEERKRKEEAEKKEKEKEEKEREKRIKEEMEEKLLMSKLPQTMNSQVKYSDYIKKGSEALQNKVALTAFDNMGRALDLIKNDYDNLGWSKNLDVASNPEVVTIRYIYARAGVDTSVYENILTAKENFELILTFHKSVRFPAVYYGLAVLYKKLNRFEESRKYVEMGLNFIEKRLAFTSVNWPGLPTQPLMETLPDQLHLLLTRLSEELVGSPLPDAVCRYTRCLTHKEQTHILPSESIFLSDPDYRGHFKLNCSENCHLDYHKVCWGLLKGEQDWQLSRIPTEKDFLGKACFTPDCDGVTISVDIFNQDGNVHKVEDSKLLERIEEEARRKKEEEKNRRLEEQKKIKESKDSNNKKKKKKKRSPSSPDSEVDVSESNSLKEVKEAEADAKKVPAPVDHSAKVAGVAQVDYSKVDVSNAVVLNKNTKTNETETELETGGKKKKPKKKKGMSLEEFHAAANIAEVPPPEIAATGDDNDFNSRIQKANKYKTFFEKIGGPPTQVSQPPSVPAVSTPPVQNAWSERARRSSVTEGGVVSAQVPTEPMHHSPQDVENIKDFIFEYLHDLLIETGPIHHQDYKIWIVLQDYKQIIDSYEGGLQTLIYMDPKNRFRHFGEHICMLDDLKIAIKMHQSRQEEENEEEEEEEEEEDEEYFIDDEEEVVEQDINKNTVNKCADRETDESDKKWQELKQLLGTSTTKTTEHTKPFDMSGMLNSLSDVNNALIADRKISAGVQTDVSSIDLDDGGMDTFTLAQTNEQLVLELQDTKDKVTRLQKENKVELSELRDKKNQLSDENTRLKSELAKMKDSMFRAERVAQEFGDKEKALKDDRERLNHELILTKSKLEEELKLSYDLRNSLVNTSSEKDQEIRTLKVYNLKVEQKYYNDLIDSNMEKSKQCSRMLEELRHNPLFSQHAANITSAMLEMDEYSARLTQARDEIEELLNTRLPNVSAEKVPKLDYDLKRIGRPKLEINVFLDFLEAGDNFGQKLNEAAAARLKNQMAGPPVGLGAVGLGPSLLGASAMMRAPPQVGGQADARGAVRGLMPNNPLPLSQNQVGPLEQIGGQSLDGSPDSNNAKGFGGLPVSRGNAFSPTPMSRTSGPPSPFRSVPPMRSSPPPALRGLPVNNRPPPLMMQPIGTRVPSPPQNGINLRPPMPSGPMEQVQQQVRPGIQQVVPGLPFSVQHGDMGRPGLASTAPGGPLASSSSTSSQPPQAGAQGGKDLSRLNLTEQAAADQGNRRKSEDKLVLRICSEFPDLSHAQARNFVKRVRGDNGGKLTGMSIPVIISKVAQYVNQETEKKDCSICLCDLDDSTVTPSCGHPFHKSCLDKWLQQEKSGNTCPNCREFITNDEEFPSLS